MTVNHAGEGDASPTRATAGLIASQAQRAQIVCHGPDTQPWFPVAQSLASRKETKGTLAITLPAAIARAAQRFAFTSVSTLALALAMMPNPLSTAPLVGHNIESSVTSQADLVTGQSAVPTISSLQKAELFSYLTNEQRTVSRYLANRYKIATDHSHEFVQLAFEAAKELSLDPWLILAIMSVESSLNPKAVSSVGAQGLMQVHARVHANKFANHGGVAMAFDPQTNIRVGAGILREYIGRHGGVKAALKAYVGAALLPEDGGYSAKVMTERERLAAVAAGRPFKEPAPISVAQSFTSATYLANASELSGSTRAASLIERQTSSMESFEQVSLEVATAERTPVVQ